MPSSGFIVHPHNDVPAKSVSATGVLLSLIQSKGSCSLPQAGESTSWSRSL